MEITHRDKGRIKTQKPKSEQQRKRYTQKIIQKRVGIRKKLRMEGKKET